MLRDLATKIQAQRHATLPVMKEPMRILLCVTAAAALAGCTSSGPVQIGKDTYIITKTSAGGAFVSGASVKAELIQEGGAHCAKSGKTLELINGEGKNAIPFVRSSSAEISFKCV